MKSSGQRQSRRDKPDHLPYIRVEPSDKFAGADVCRLSDADLHELNSMVRNGSNGKLCHAVEYEVRRRRLVRGRRTAARRRPRTY